MKTINYPPQFNRFECAKAVRGTTISIEQLTEEISTPSRVAEIAYQLSKDDSKKYKEVKQTRFPVFSPNSYTTTNNRSSKVNSLIKEKKRSTGYIGLDFDLESEEEAKAFKKTLITHRSVALCWITLSKKGVAALVKLDRCFRDDHDAYWEKINELFDHKADPYTKGYDRVFIIPHDPDVFFNPSSVAIDPIINSSIAYRYYLPDEEFNRELYKYFPNGRLVYEPVNLFQYAKSKIKETTRHKILAKISQQLILLNPNATDGLILQQLLYINNHYCEKPKPRDQVERIVRSNFAKHKSGKLGFKSLMKRQYVFFKRNHGLPRREVSSIIARCTNERKNQGMEAVCKAIFLAVEEMKGKEKITKKALALRLTKSAKTIQRYWGRFQERIKRSNDIHHENIEGGTALLFSPKEEKEYSNPVPPSINYDQIDLEYEQDLTQLEITMNEVLIGFDQNAVGLRLSQITDLGLLITWFNFYNPGDNNKIYTGLWIRINQIHPKYILRFDDLIEARGKICQMPSSQIALLPAA